MPQLVTAAAAERRSPGGTITLLAWAHFLNDGAANYLPGVLPAILGALTLPIASAGELMGVLIAFQALQPFAGVLADRRATRALVTVGLAGSSLGAALIGWASTPVMLIAALVLIGICNTLFHPPALAGVRRLASGGGEHATAFFLVGGEIGRGVWPLLASILVTAWGLHALWVLSLAAIPTLPLLWMRARPPEPTPPRLGAWHGLRRVSRPLRGLIAYSALRAVLIIGVSAFVPLLWRERGGSLTEGAGLITTMLVVGVIGNLGGAALARRWGRRRPVLLASAAWCVLLPAFLLSRGAWLWITMALFGIAVFATLPLTVLMCQDLLPRQHSLASGLALGFSNALGAAIVAALGLFALAWGAQGVLWAIAACGLAALLLAPILPAAAAKVE
ncbi:MAG: MFS transporter [Terriglobales bacterium]